MKDSSSFIIQKVMSHSSILKNYFIVMALVLTPIFLSCEIAAPQYYITPTYSMPRFDLSMNISTNVTEIYRGDLIKISYSLSGKDHAIEDICGVIKIPAFIENVTVTCMSKGYIYDEKNKKILFSGDLKKGEFKNCSYEATISLNAATVEYDLSETIDYWHWRRMNYFNINGNYLINISNNKPEIYCAQVQVLKTRSPLLPSENMLSTAENNSIEVIFNVSAYDKENDKLIYNWKLKTSNETYTILRTSDMRAPYILNIPPGKYFSFYVSAEDVMGDSSQEARAVVSAGGSQYTNIYVASGMPIVIYVIVILLLFFIQIIRTNLSEVKYLNKIRSILGELHYAKEFAVLLILLSVTFVYIFLILYSYRHIEYVFYFRSLNLFEIYIYLLVFITIVYFTESCFGPHDQSDSQKLTTITSKLWIINSIFMLIILISLDSILVKIDPNHIQNWMISVYSEIGEIFATILAIVAALYTTIPKNILVGLKSMFVMNPEKSISKLPKFDFHRYSINKILNFFIILYSAIVALSIWGFSAGPAVEFSLILNFNWNNIFNLISIAVFYITLLLVPPAISCLYELLRSTLHTGNIIIKSFPEEANVILDGYDTNLITPIILVLPSGTHSILLRKNGYEDCTKLKQIEVQPGTEIQYSCRLYEKIELW